MIADLAEYPWSCYGVRGLGREDALVRPLPAWERLRLDAEKRRAYWRQWTHTLLTEKEWAEVRRSVKSGRPYGEAWWAEAKAAQLGLPAPPKPRSRRRKQKI